MPYAYRSVSRSRASLILSAKTVIGNIETRNHRNRRVTCGDVDIVHGGESGLRRGGRPAGLLAGDAVESAFVFAP